MRGQDGLGSKSNRTALLAFFGQVVTNEIVMASESGCPIEMHRIEIEKCDEMYDPECLGDKYIPFHRAAYDRNTGQSPNAPREQINQMTAWIDGSFIYSTSEAWLNAMRSFVNGTLLTDETGVMPVRNKMRVPLFNNPLPHVMRRRRMERLFRKYIMLNVSMHKCRNFNFLFLAYLQQFLVTLGRTRTRVCYRLPFYFCAGTMCWPCASSSNIRHGWTKTCSSVPAALSSRPFKMSSCTSICRL